MHLLNLPFWTQSGASAWTHKHSLNIVMGPCRPAAGLPLLHVWPGSGQGVAVPPSQLRSACLYLPPSCETRGNAGRHEQEAVSIIHARPCVPPRSPLPPPSLLRFPFCLLSSRTNSRSSSRPHRLPSRKVPVNSSGYRSVRLRFLLSMN